MVQGAHHNATPERASALDVGDASPDEKRKKVGNYVILKTIGEGSFAKVRLGVHLITEMKVAVKVINKREVFKRNYLRANLRREASMMQRMSHKNIVQLHEVMETENSYYIVMDLVQGNEFVKYLTKRKQLDENETKKYIRQIVSAVDHMHRARVIHRDIKLQNFMLDQNNDIIIIDFGLSNCLDDKGFLTTQCGSPAYAAPEIFAHQEYGPAVDVWSIGVNMYAMLVGKLPFKVEHRSRNLAKLHACILKGCEIPNTLSRECHDLLSRLLDPSPSKRITIPEILRHPFLTDLLGPIELVPFKPHTDLREINQSIIRYLSMKYGYSEHEVEEAVLHRKPIACRALYSLIERRLKEGLGWPDRTYNSSVNAQSTISGTGVASVVDGTPDLVLDKLGRHEPLLPGRRALPHHLPLQVSPPTANGQKLTRERSNFGFDEQILVRTNANANSITQGLTQEALNELVPQSKLISRKLFQDSTVRKSSAIATNIEQVEEIIGARRAQQNSNTLAPIRNSISTQRGNVLIPQQTQQHKAKPRSLPNSTLDHANQNGFHVPHDLVLGASADNRTPKAISRTSQVDNFRKNQHHSPVRYNPAPSVTVKAIGLFLKNSALHSRVSSCSSRSSKTNGTTTVLDVQHQSPPLKFYPPTSNTNHKQNVVTYHSHGNLTSTDTTRQFFVKTAGSSNRITASKAQHSTATGANGEKLMPT
ncbi:unnamed protein product [Rotaria socialis]|uniref:non-specific serine/threonine protein kinase n=2 Tax=Rotaria socialis TaxID=392032 RepID=A0A818P522_9BILA|nr:unnamed protein product [Rotaria socialis]CAF3506014.1 unnamed protein product [Rotaria socialis]CAF3617637.1 unnamed protein product [Rotaria socialis]CAF4394088.1 unnamed protein product [Rotaria socialis]CAF4743367.1 unnamed protein product [Rotaria socialis]